MNSILQNQEEPRSFQNDLNNLLSIYNEELKKEVDDLKQKKKDLEEEFQNTIGEIFHLNKTILELEKKNMDLEKRNNHLKHKFHQKMCLHITFFYREERFSFLNNIIDEVAEYRYVTDIYIHTNTFFDKTLLHDNLGGSVFVIVHHLENEKDPLTWKCRSLLKKQVDDYDYFMYIEDDILVKKEAIEYWFHYKDRLIENGFNLGFVRVEVDENGEEFVSDIFEKIENFVCFVEGEQFIVNNKFPFCCFWIYDKKEFTKWTQSSFYDPANIKGYGVTEQSAVGLHGLCTGWYRTTVLPLNNNFCLLPECKIYDMSQQCLKRREDKNFPNGKIKFSECVQY